jgi:magnesium-transporting ATPase (P-type)
VAHYFVFVKGAPERILSMCKNQRSTDGKTEQLDMVYWNEKIENIAALGQRMLAFAVKSVKQEHTMLEHSDAEGTLTLLGMVGMIDPPRSEAIIAVAECHDAGIRVMMITGDHAKTAAAVAKQIGLQYFDKVLTGADLDRMDDVLLRQVVLDCNIFARTNPEHKLRLVMALQFHNMSVAMTGDGVNDAPTLKRTDVGIAMAKKGSEVAKEAAEFVLEDDILPLSLLLCVRDVLFTTISRR